jgi:hypothetical protein
MSFDKYEQRQVFDGNKNVRVMRNPFWVSTSAIHLSYHSPVQASIPAESPVNLTIPGTPPFRVYPM